MAKVHNANHDIVCASDEKDGSIIVKAKGCKTILKPDKLVKYKIEATKE